MFAEWSGNKHVCGPCVAGNVCGLTHAEKTTLINKFSIKFDFVFFGNAKLILEAGFSEFINIYFDN